MAIVLVVDDEFGIAALLKDVFEDEGHRVVLVTNGRQALDRIAEDRRDLVLTDFMMPVMDGAALIQALAGDNATRGSPVLIMTSMPETVVAERCSDYVSFIRKSFKIYDVLDVVAGLLCS